ncbi:hypothetical protein NEF87_000384 [Candidatus Lokiarchaeum ossiferum]|uniref:Type II methyltransferase n=1 Tax=Candidatus Lokiarchaeum ossiferum TaxID=2951803 RepID=A0ABY6HNN4_9ARCH|nr:hypothetical protein NEF87_000384 [Candidatus Lokiarchaeum sp. B-35]
MDEIEDETVTLVVTSPPYWDVRDYGSDQIGFQQSYKDYILALNRVWKECVRVLQPNGKIAINLQPLPISSQKSGYGRRVIKDIMNDVENFMFDQGLFLSGMIFWDKAPYINNVSWGSYPKPSNIATNTAFEQIYTFVKPGKTRPLNKHLVNQSLLSKDEWRHWAVRMVWDDISPVIKINQHKENLFGHSAPYPEDIPYRLIRMHTLKNELVVDPFLGSGTTLKMTRLTQRRGIGYEINGAYANLIKDRIMEEWTTPYIDSQYKTFSSRNISKIIQESINTSLNFLEKCKIGSEKTYDQKKNEEERRLILKAVLKTLRHQKILSQANIKKISEEFNNGINS